MPSIEVLEFFNSKFGLIGIFIISIFLFIPQLPKYLDSIGYFKRIKLDRLKESLDSPVLDNITKNIIEDIYLDTLFLRATGMNAPKSFRQFMFDAVNHPDSSISYKDFRKALPYFHIDKNKSHNRKWLTAQLYLYSTIGSILFVLSILSGLYFLFVIIRMDLHEIRNSKVYIALGGWAFNNIVFFLCSAFSFRVVDRISTALRIGRYLDSHS